jgi:ABC-type uncharacterized transport system involved in gliding motility auxiliary subunit
VLECLRRTPLTLRLFYSRRLGAELPAYGAHAERVRNLLREYVTASRGKLRLEILDPEPFSDVEDRAVARGLQGVPLDGGGEQVFFGLVGSNARDDERLVPFFQPERERFLEAELTRVVVELSNPTKPVLGLMTALPLNGDPRALMLRQPALAQPQVVIRQLRENFELRDIGFDATVIPPEVQVLILAHPQGLPDAAQYAVDQFVLRGGKLLLLLDPHSEMQASRPGMDGRPPADTASSLDRLLAAWGVEAPAGQVVADLRGAWRVRARPGDRVQAVDYVAWFSLQGDSLSGVELATAQLEQVSVASAGTLRPWPGPAPSSRRCCSPPRNPCCSTRRGCAASRTRCASSPASARWTAPCHRRPAARPCGQRLPGRAAGTGGGAGAASGAQPGPGQPRDHPRCRPAGGSLLGPRPGSRRAAGGHGLRRQWRPDPQPCRPACRLGCHDRPALAGESQRPFERVEAIRRQAEAQFRASEQALTERLQATEARLRTLRQGTPAGERNAAQAIITPEQRAEIEAAREQIAATRRELRAVQLELRRDIEALEQRMRLFNILAMPLLLAVLAVVVALLRAQRRAAARA